MSQILHSQKREATLTHVSLRRHFEPPKFLRAPWIFGEPRPVLCFDAAVCQNASCGCLGVSHKNVPSTGGSSPKGQSSKIPGWWKVVILRCFEWSSIELIQNHLGSAIAARATLIGQLGASNGSLYFAVPGTIGCHRSWQSLRLEFLHTFCRTVNCPAFHQYHFMIFYGIMV